ncbi:nucleotidyltransferase family protein [Primorskyibacter sp. S187A]|uniref:nucleotidyltransferase family protein n=1 Tax=Primorskyibacter sp. S187A TaxID=3415130 RepID=UPI003C7B3170
MPEAALFFAAGFGTRMRPLTDTCPKPLIRVAGQTLLDHALALGEAIPLKRRVVNTHYRHEQIEAHLAGRDILLSHETPDILETGGGLRQALPLLGEGAVFTCNTDAIWSDAAAMAQLRAAWEPAQMDALLLCVPAARAIGHGGDGDFSLSPDGQLTRGGSLIYTGVQIIDPKGLSAISETSFSLNLLWTEMAAKGRLHGIVYGGAWCDVGQPESIQLAEDMLRHV